MYQNKPGPSSRRTTPCRVRSRHCRSGRPLAGNLSNVTVNLIEPGTLYGDRINQLDFRIAKILKLGRTRTTVGVDLYNALNSSTVLVYNNTFVPGGHGCSRDRS